MAIGEEFVGFPCLVPEGLSFFLRDGVGERGGGVLNGNEGWRTGVKGGFED